jgi:transaldolase/transaldolase/glucose-6-phosphate isomerase
MIDEGRSHASGDESHRLASLRDGAAVANAKVAYSRFLELFGGEVFARLRAAGARPQRPLWASLGTKDPAYSDVKYVEALIGPDTVSTMPEGTADAFRDHGRVADTLTEDIEGARSVVADLEGIGIDLVEAGDRLQEQGVKLFTEAHQTMAQTVKFRHSQLAAQRAARRPH